MLHCQVHLSDRSYIMDIGSTMGSGGILCCKHFHAWEKYSLTCCSCSNIRGRFLCRWCQGPLPPRFARGCLDLLDTARQWRKVNFHFMLGWVNGRNVPSLCTSPTALPLVSGSEMLPHFVGKFIIKYP